MVVSTEEAIAAFFAALLVIGFLAAFLFMGLLKVSAKKSEIDAARAKKKKAKNALKAKRKRNYIDYF